MSLAPLDLPKISHFFLGPENVCTRGAGEHVKVSMPILPPPAVVVYKSRLWMALTDPFGQELEATMSTVIDTSSFQLQKC